MNYKQQIKESIDDTIDEITLELEKVEAKLIEVENCDLEDIKLTATEALVIVQDLLFDLR